MYIASPLWSSSIVFKRAAAIIIVDRAPQSSTVYYMVRGSSKHHVAIYPTLEYFLLCSDWEGTPSDYRCPYAKSFNFEWFYLIVIIFFPIFPFYIEAARCIYALMYIHLPTTYKHIYVDIEMHLRINLDIRMKYSTST